VSTLGSPLESRPPLGREPGSGRRLRFMNRRRINRLDRNGDPLDGLVNLFDVAIVLAVAFLLAALTGIGLSGVLSSKDLTIVTNPGQTDMQIITKQGEKVTKLQLNGQQVTGTGTKIGEFYRLPDGTTVYVPSSGATPAPGGSASPAPLTTPTPSGVQVAPTPATTAIPGTVPNTVPGTVPTVGPSSAPGTEPIQ